MIKAMPQTMQPTATNRRKSRLRLRNKLHMGQADLRYLPAKESQAAPRGRDRLIIAPNMINQLMSESTTLGRIEQRATRGRKKNPNNFYTSRRRSTASKKQKTLQGDGGEGWEGECGKEVGKRESWDQVDLGQLSANTTVIIVVVVAVWKRNQLIDKRPFDEVLQGGREEWRGRRRRRETS